MSILILDELVKSPFSLSFRVKREIFILQPIEKTRFLPAVEMTHSMNSTFYEFIILDRYRMNNFYTQFFSEIFSSLPNNYIDNYDFYRFGKPPSPPKNKFSLKSIIKQYLNNKDYGNINYISQELCKATKFIEPYASQFNKLYDILADQYSKNLLVKILAYRCLGHRKVKLPLSNPNYWKTIEDIDKIKDSSDYIEVTFLKNVVWRLNRFNLHRKIAPIELYFSAPGVYIDFVIRQYEYHSPNTTIKANDDDIVIDAGACWGDTALYFANKVGEKGRVYSFEFVPSNISIFKKNLALNQHMINRIKLIKNPLYDRSDTASNFKDQVPAIRITSEQFEGCDGIVTSISIDDFVEEYNLTSVDFIKMDIEGAEPIALKGAIETIKKFKPKLAIAIYHSTGKHGMDDFVNIPAYINNLDLGYKLYLGH